MTKNLKNAFVPNEMRTSLLHITSYEGQNFVGYLENPYYEQKLAFNNLTQMLFLLEDLFDELGCPQRSNERRSLTNQKNYPQSIPQLGVQTDQKLASFKILILFRQNASWQGVCEWVDKNKSANFRSALELVQLMDSVLNTL